LTLLFNPTKHRNLTGYIPTAWPVTGAMAALLGKGRSGVKPIMRETAVVAMTMKSHWWKSDTVTSAAPSTIDRLSADVISERENVDLSGVGAGAGLPWPPNS